MVKLREIMNKAVGEASRNPDAADEQKEDEDSDDSDEGDSDDGDQSQRTRGELTRAPGAREGDGASGSSEPMGYGGGKGSTDPGSQATAAGSLDVLQRHRPPRAAGRRSQNTNEDKDGDEDENGGIMTAD